MSVSQSTQLQSVNSVTKQRQLENMGTHLHTSLPTSRVPSSTRHLSQSVQHIRRSDQPSNLKVLPFAIPPQLVHSQANPQNSTLAQSYQAHSMSLQHNTTLQQVPNFQNVAASGPATGMMIPLPEYNSFDPLFGSGRPPTIPQTQGVSPFSANNTRGWCTTADFGPLSPIGLIPDPPLCISGLMSSTAKSLNFDSTRPNSSSPSHHTDLHSSWPRPSHPEQPVGPAGPQLSGVPPPSEDLLQDDGEVLLFPVTPSTDDSTLRTMISSLRTKLQTAIFQAKQQVRYIMEVEEQKVSIVAENLEIQENVRTSQEHLAFLQQQQMEQSGVPSESLGSLRGRALDISTRELVRVRAAYLEIQKEVMKLRQQLKLARLSQSSQFYAIQRECVRLTRERNQTHILFSARGREISDFKGREKASFEKNEKESSENSDKLKKQADELEKLSKSFSDLEGVHTRTLEKCKELSKSLETAEISLKSKQEETQQKTRELSDARSSFDVLHRQLHDVTEADTQSSDAVEKMAAKHEGELQKLRRELEDHFEDKISEQNDIMTQLQNDVDAAEDYVLQHQKSMETLNSDLEQKARECCRMSEELKELQIQTQNRGDSDELEGIREERDQLEVDFERLRGENQSHMDEIISLRQHCSKLESEHSKPSSSGQISISTQTEQHSKQKTNSFDRDMFQTAVKECDELRRANEQLLNLNKKYQLEIGRHNQRSDSPPTTASVPCSPEVSSKAIQTDMKDVDDCLDKVRKSRENLLLEVEELHEIMSNQRWQLEQMKTQERLHCDELQRYKRTDDSLASPMVDSSISVESKKPSLAIIACSGDYSRSPSEIRDESRGPFQDFRPDNIESHENVKITSSLSIVSKSSTGPMASLAPKSEKSEDLGDPGSDLNENDVSMLIGDVCLSSSENENVEFSRSERAERGRSPGQEEGSGGDAGDQIVHRSIPFTKIHSIVIPPTDEISVRRPTDAQIGILSVELAPRCNTVPQSRHDPGWFLRIQQLRYFRNREACRDSRRPGIC
eukprot:438336_1